ncbi:MAG: hypothetical protein KC425_23015 [Anaerolineales bacterium]|nr:hypothetical protein [Anaerolineales bacterium]
MDLRVVKTKKNIRAAFLALRAQQALEKVRVTRLCELALINKTTFYKHYQDIYALSEEIENETIQSIMNSFADMHALFVDPDGFIRGLYDAFKAHDEIITILFSGRMDNLIDKIETHLTAHYPWISGTPENEIVLSFLLWGAAHVLMEPRYDEAVLLDTSTSVAKQVLSLFSRSRAGQ